MRRVDVMVLVEVVVEVVQHLLVTLVLPVQAHAGVQLRRLRRLERAGHQRHELAEDADAAVPEHGLRQVAGRAPAVGAGVVRLHHVRQLEGVVVAARHVQLAAQDGHAAAHVHLGGGWLGGGGEGDTSLALLQLLQF